MHHSLTGSIRPIATACLTLLSLMAAAPAQTGAPAQTAGAGTSSNAARTAAIANAVPVVLAPCQIEDSLRVSVVSADCGTLFVPEDPRDPGSRRIGLHVARVAAISRNKRPDPLFVLAGGPGMAATVFFASTASAFERIHRDRDIILLDQRGTGRSNPLPCALSDDLLDRAEVSEIANEARGCLQTLSNQADVRFYTTSVAVGDLDRIRAALGYQAINLYGVSYGTRVAQHYLRRFPEHVRSVVLDGVIPPQRILGPDIALNAETALSRILARCEHETDCRARFSHAASEYQQLRDSLRSHPVSVSLSDPTSGAALKLQFTRFHFATVLRLATYTAEQAALLPYLLHEAAGSGDYTGLAAQFLLVTRTYGGAVSYGMHNSIVCSEDAPFYDSLKIDRAELERTYLGTSQLDGLHDICSVWPRGPVDPDFHQPLHTDVPVLLLSGSDDPVTPPQGADEARGGFTHNLHLVLAGFGHGQITAPCIGRVVANFVARASVTGLDAGCIRNDKPLAFFASLGGPPP